MTDTKDDTQKRIEELERQLVEKQQLLDAQDEKLRKLVAKGEGWLVTTQNPLYDGQAFGIQFVNGQAFIRRGQRVEAFEFKPVKDEYFVKMAFTPEKIKETREREKIPSAERAVVVLRDDFGYQVEYFDTNRLIELQGRIDARLGQRMQAEDIQQQQMQAEKVMMPAYIR